jgi:hypothetical protein
VIFVFAEGDLRKGSQDLFVGQFNQNYYVGDVVNQLMRVRWVQLIQSENQFGFLDR